MDDYHFVGLIMRDETLAGQVLEIWANAGAWGVTILDTKGQEVSKKQFNQDDLPLFPSLSTLLGNYTKINQKLLFAIVKDSVMADQLISLTQQVTGDLTKPGRGILFVMPLARVLGVGVY